MRLCAQASLGFTLAMGLYWAVACSKDSTDASGRSDANAPQSATQNGTRGDAMIGPDALADGAQSIAAGDYTAYNIVSGLYRYRIVKADPTRNVCFMIGLVGTMPNTTGVSLPPDWNVEYARALQPAAACQPSSVGDPTATVDASNVTGAIAWVGGPAATSFDSVDVTVTFDGRPAWCPPSERFSATNLKIQ